MKPNKAKLTELRTIRFSFNQAKSHLLFTKKPERTYDKMVSYFGIKSEDNRIVEIPKDLELFRDELIKKVEEKYDEKDTKTKYDYPSKVDEISSERDELVSRSTFIPQYPDQTTKLLTQKEGGCEQVNNTRILWDNLTQKDYRGQLLRAGTGAGKTYMLASFIKNFIEQGLCSRYGFCSPMPIMYVTKSSVVEQTETVLKYEFGIDIVNTVHVINIEQLRAKLGKVFISEETEVIFGEEHTRYKWHGAITPCLVIWDECQMLARTDHSIQAKIAQALNWVAEETGRHIFQIFASATPFSRVGEAGCFAVSTGTTFNLGGGEVKVTNQNWKVFAQIIASPSDPYEYCEAAIKRFYDHLEPYIVQVKGIRPKFKAYNNVKPIHFKTAEEQEEYLAALNRYQEEKKRIESDETLSASQNRFVQAAQLTIFAQAAEFIRRYHLAEFIVKSYEAGYAPVLAVRFKKTQTAVFKILVQKYGWKKSDISMIWGGSTQTLSKKKKIAKKLASNEAMMQMMEEMGIDEEDLRGAGIDIKNIQEKTEEELKFERDYELMGQTLKKREQMRLAFQRGEAKCCIFNFKSGGVGLSLHHEKKYPNARPRTVLLTPVYSEKELIQGLGRCPRITSMSDTTQMMVYYVGTIEEAVAAKVVMKLKCAKVVTGRGESWEDIITGTKNIEVENKQIDYEEMLELQDEQDGEPMMVYGGV